MYAKSSTFNKRVGTRAQVMHGNAKMTGGGLMKKDLKYNKAGKIVSKKLSRIAKQEKRLQKAGYETQKGVFQLFQKQIGGSEEEEDEYEHKGGAPVEAHLNSAIYYAEEARKAAEKADVKGAENAKDRVEEAANEAAKIAREAARTVEWAKAAAYAEAAGWAEKAARNAVAWANAAAWAKIAPSTATSAAARAIVAAKESSLVSQRAEEAAAHAARNGKGVEEVERVAGARAIAAASSSSSSSVAPRAAPGGSAAAASQSVSAGLNENERMRLGIKESLAAPGGSAAAASQSVSAGLNENERMRLGIKESLAAPGGAAAAPGGAGAMAAQPTLHELITRASLLKNSNNSYSENNKKRAINALAKDIKNLYFKNTDTDTIKTTLVDHNYNITTAIQSLYS